MGGKGDYGREKEVEIKDIDRNGRKQIKKRKIHDEIIHQKETKSVSSSRTSVFATVKEAIGHFPVGLTILLINKETPSQGHIYHLRY